MPCWPSTSPSVSRVSRRCRAPPHRGQSKSVITFDVQPTSEWTRLSPVLTQSSSVYVLIIILRRNRKPTFKDNQKHCEFWSCSTSSHLTIVLDYSRTVVRNYTSAQLYVFLLFSLSLLYKLVIIRTTRRALGGAHHVPPTKLFRRETE